MPAYRYPLLLIRDAAGGCTALPVDCIDGLCGFGSTARAATDQVREYLTWYERKQGGLTPADLLDPELIVIKVMPRPEYKTPTRLDPCPEAVTVRVPCVFGMQKDGRRAAALPLLNIRFTYSHPDALKPLAARYALQKLEGLTPRELARHLPPAKVELTELVVGLPRVARPPASSGDPPALAAVAEPLGVRAARRQYGRAWERDAELKLLVEKIQKEPASLLLVGEPGVGKTTLLVEAARAVELAGTTKKADGDEESVKVPARSRFWQTSAGRLIAGMRYLGQWEERCEQVIAELSLTDGILCAERLLDLVRTGGIGPGDSLAAFFAPYLQRGELRLIGEATPAELDACRRLLPGFADLFQLVSVPPFDRPKALTVLGRAADHFRQNLKLDVAADAPERVYHLFRRFAPYESFPGKTVAFFKGLCEAQARAKLSVTAAAAVDRFGEQTGLPERFLRDDLRLDRARVLAALERQVIGQPGACAAAADLITTFKAGLNDPNRPVGVLLFCGPTGVGKTELARTLAKCFFGRSDPEAIADDAAPERLIRLDMSEYAGPDAVERLLGPPAGEPSSLVRQLRQQPFCVLLLDEVEKAGPEVFDVLLGVCDEGRLTDRYGRVTSFRSAVIVLTSNLGADRGTALGFRDQVPVRYADEAMKFFRPEFFNRLDAVVTFHPLPADVVRQIARKELQALARREGLGARRLELRPTERLVAHLAEVGFDPRYGARPLQRTLERLVVTPLAKFLLAHPDLTSTAVSADVSADGVALFALA